MKESSRFSASVFIIVSLGLQISESRPHQNQTTEIARPSRLVSSTQALSFFAARNGTNSSADQVTHLADEYVSAFALTFPESAALQGMSNTRDDVLTDNSLAAVKRWEKQEDALYTQLQRLDQKTMMGRPEHITFGYLQEQLESSRQSRVCRNELWGVNQAFGWQVSMAASAGIQLVGSDQARKNALARWRLLPKFIDTEIANLREGLRRGYSAPKYNVQLVIKQLDSFLTKPVTNSPLYSPAARDDSPEFKGDFETLLSDEINPTIQRYRDFLEKEYLPKARERVGVLANRNGAACYQASIRAYTSLNMMPDEIHRLGLREVDRIQKEMEEIAEKNFGTRDVGEAIKKSEAKPEYQFHSREEMVAFAQELVNRVEKEMPKWFGRVPKARVIVEPFPTFRETSSPGGQYFPASEDGRRPGKYLINTLDAEKKNRVGYEPLTFHEAIPGHHFQISLAMERPAAHPLTRFFACAAFVEGWGLYAEALGDEAGLYSSDAARLAMLNSAKFRAARLVVDTGIHDKGWTRQQAIDYMMKTVSYTSIIPSEVDRYIIWPGQATAYMIGKLEIIRLRRMAEEKLGPKFDIREFHDRVLEDGSVTLPMLREKIESWLAK